MARYYRDRCIARRPMRSDPARIRGSTAPPRSGPRASRRSRTASGTPRSSPASPGRPASAARPLPPRAAVVPQAKAAGAEAVQGHPRAAVHSEGNLIHESAYHRQQRPDRLRGRRLLRPPRVARSTGSTTTCGPTSSAPAATPPGTSAGSRRPVAVRAPPAGYSRSRGDVRRVRRHGPDLIIHCAAQPSHDLAKTRPFDDFDVNAGGTLNLLEATRRHVPDAVFVLMSTNKVYGDAPNELPLIEVETRYDYSRPRGLHGIDETCRVDRARTVSSASASWRAT